MHTLLAAGICSCSDPSPMEELILWGTQISYSSLLGCTQLQLLHLPLCCRIQHFVPKPSSAQPGACVLISLGCCMQHEQRVSKEGGFLRLEPCENLLLGQTFALQGLASAPGRDGVITLRSRSCQDAVSGECCFFPASSALQQPGSLFCLFFWSLPLFLWNSVQHEHSRDPRGSAALWRRRLVLCQILCWGKAEGNPFCSVSARAVGKSHARCSSP